MKTNIGNNSSRRGLRALATASLAMVGVLGVGSVSAGGIPVVDGIHLGLTKLGWVGQYAQMYDEFAKLQEQYTELQEHTKQLQEQYNQMLVKGATYNLTPGYRENIDTQFPERDINYGVTERCKKKNNPVGEEQYNLCVATVQTENRRFNAVRALLNDVKTNDAQLQAAVAEREDIPETNLGALHSNSNRQASIQAKMENDLQNAQYTLDAYDAALATLKRETEVLARKGLNNHNNLLGTAIQGASLKLALQAARQRER